MWPPDGWDERVASLQGRDPGMPRPQDLAREGSMKRPIELWEVEQATLERYLKLAIDRPTFEWDEEGRFWFGEIPGFPGVWADAASQEACQKVLAEVLTDWLSHKLHDVDDDIPVIGGINLLAVARPAPSV